MYLHTVNLHSDRMHSLKFAGMETSTPLYALASMNTSKSWSARPYLYFSTPRAKQQS